MIGVWLALGSALVYGASDFFGGLAARRHSQFQVLGLASLVGLLAMLALAFARREGWPSPADCLWAGLGGLAGVLGLAILYRGLAHGQAAVVSPVSGVTGAMLPVLFALLAAGLPNLWQLAGFALAAPAIWLVTLAAGGDRRQARAGILPGVTSGLLFGLFFIFMARVQGLFGPLAVAKLVSCLVMAGLLAWQRAPLPGPRASPLALLCGLFDPLANALFLAAKANARLDVAVVLTALYPAGTVLLAVLFLKQRLARPQSVGVALCLAAIALITYGQTV